MLPYKFAAAIDSEPEATGVVARAGGSECQCSVSTRGGAAVCEVCQKSSNSNSSQNVPGIANSSSISERSRRDSAEVDDIVVTLPGVAGDCGGGGELTENDGAMARGICALEPSTGVDRAVPGSLLTLSVSLLALCLRRRCKFSACFDA